MCVMILEVNKCACFIVPPSGLEVTGAETNTLMAYHSSEEQT